MRGIVSIGMATTVDAVEKNTSGIKNAIVAAGMRDIVVITHAGAGAVATRALGNPSVASGEGSQPATSA